MGQQSTPKDAAITVNNTAPLVTYNGSFCDADTASNVIKTVVPPVLNVNGMYIEFAEIAILCMTGGSQKMVVSLLAKNGAPSSGVDGDLIMVSANGLVSSTGANAPHHQFLNFRVKIPAGKGLYIHQIAPGSLPDSCVKTILYTLIP